MKTDLFQSCGHCWVFQISWHIECSTVTASSFTTWKSSTRIPSLPLASFIVLLPKAHLTSDVWLYMRDHTTLCSCHLFLISSASVWSISFLSFIVPIFAWNVPLVSLIFLKKSLAFIILLFSCISLHGSLRKAVLSLLAVLWNSAFKWEFLTLARLIIISLICSLLLKYPKGSYFYISNITFNYNLLSFHLTLDDHCS